MLDKIDQSCVDTIRTLAMDAVQEADSGHPGAPMAMAPVAYALWQRHLRFDPNDPVWPNRDRFVLSAEHASMLLYALLHLTGVKAVNRGGETSGEAAVSLADIRNFRQLDSRTPGHPEYRWTADVETTTGPLGQGAATSVGMAIAGRWLAATFNRPGFDLFDFDVYALAGDGCMMEGPSGEAASLAGHLKLSNLCWIYDNNRITIEGRTDLAFTEDVAAQFSGYGWNVLHVDDANDLAMLSKAFHDFRNTHNRPTLIIVDSHIAYGAPNKQDTHPAHGEPLMDSGELRALIDAGVMGVTSNPSIFEKAIVGSADYDNAIKALAANGKSIEKIYEALAIEDIQRTADLLRPIYDGTNGVDGYVSPEVSPTLAHDTEGTIADARRLHAALNRPNVMIKVPATPAGIPAIEALIGEGIPINVTLIFGLSTYEAVAEAHIAGLEKLSAAGGDVSKVASMASFFVSRIDSAVDAALAALNAVALQGKIAIANAKLAYARSQDIFSGDRWHKLADRGARVQRLLWASTGTKNPAYSDTLYLDELIGRDTVNTVPPATLDAFLDHGTIAPTLGQGFDNARSQLEQ
ncbi:MAG: transaldolase, partial [Anaerolineae bacterium]